MLLNLKCKPAAALLTQSIFNIFYIVHFFLLCVYILTVMHHNTREIPLYVQTYLAIKPVSDSEQCSYFSFEESYLKDSNMILNWALCVFTANLHAADKVCHC